MNAILAVSTIVFPLITFPYISRVLLVEGNGKIAFASSVINYFSMLASLGIPTYGIRACAKVRGDKEKLSKTVQELLIINLITTGISFLALLVLIAVIPEFQAEKELLLINGIGMILATCGVTWLYNALEQYAYITICSVAFKVLSIVMMFLFVKKPEDYVVYGAVSVIAGSGSYVLNLINLRKYITIKKSGKYHFKQHIKPILIFFAMSAAINVYTNLDVVMLKFMQGDTAVGYYNAAIKIKTILVMLITSLGTVLLPRLSFYTQEGDETAFRRMIGKAADFVVIVGLPLTIYFSMYAKESILFLAGKEFAGAIIPMILLMPTVLLIGLSNITGIQVLTPRNEEKKVLYSILCGAAVDFLLNWFLIPRYSASGAAFATLIAEFVVLMVQCVYLKQFVLDIVRKISIGKILLASAGGSLAGCAVKYLMENAGILGKYGMEMEMFMILLLSAVVFFGVYGGILLLTKEKFMWEIWESVLGKIRRRH